MAEPRREPSPHSSKVEGYGTVFPLLPSTVQAMALGREGRKPVAGKGQPIVGSLLMTEEQKDMSGLEGIRGKSGAGDQRSGKIWRQEI